MEDGLMCFDTAKREAQNASHAAEMAFNISEQAKEVSYGQVQVFHDHYLY